MERQLVDEDAFMFSQEDRRSKIEFYIPLVFYLFGFLVLFNLHLAFPRFRALN
jgi:hypothetical protein